MDRNEANDGMSAREVSRASSMEDLLHELLLGSLQAAGCIARSGSLWQVQSAALAGAPRFLERWLAESLATLAAHGLLRPQGKGSFRNLRGAASLVLSWHRWEECKGDWIREGANPALIALVEMCVRALPDILSGRRRSTAVLFPDSSTQLVGAVYSQNAVADYFNDVLAKSLVTLMSERRKRDPQGTLRVLEVGAGTGATSQAVLKQLAAAGLSLTEYCFTDLSQAFLAEASRRFGPKATFLQTRRLDIEVSCLTQGFTAGRYDFVIAANVLHATRHIRGSLRNLKALLKRCGVLLINELGVKTLANHLTFGLLEGWWRYEDEAWRIPGSPLLTVDSWVAALREEGFRQIVVPASVRHEWGQQILIAESDGWVRTPREISPASGDWASERSGGAETEQTVARAVREQVALNRRSVRHQEPDSGALPGARAADGMTEQMIADHVTDLLRECLADALKIPHADIRDTSGFQDYGVDSLVAVRLINHVNRSLGLTLPTTVLFDYSSVANLSRHIVQTYEVELGRKLTGARSVSSTSQLLTGGSKERKAGKAAASRAREDTATAVGRSAGDVSKRGDTRCEASRYWRVLVRGPMPIDAVELSQAEAPVLSAHQVCVSVRAFALSFADLLCIQGLYPTLPEYPFAPGMDAAGVVVAVGEAVTAVRVGDEVITGINDQLGAHATLVVVGEDRLFPKPAGVSFEEACTLNTATMAIVGAFRKADLQHGESILIQSATGGVGLTAVQLARHRDARIYATVGSAHKVDYLTGVGVAHVMDYETQDFEAEVMRLTQSRGVDVVINTLAGEAIQKGLNCLASGGRYIELAAVALRGARSIDLSALGSNKSVHTINIRALYRQSPQTLAAYREEMLELWRAGVIAPPIGRVFEFAQLKEAYRYLESRQSIGKVVVRVPESDWFVAGTMGARESSRSQGMRTDEAAITRTDSQQKLEKIAIIGMSGRFAQSPTLEAFWSHLAAGHNLIERATRWDLASSVAAIADERHPYCDRGSFLEGIAEFDPLFFEISGTEAAYMDPQQRLFLQECWKTLEDAGYAGTAGSGTECGVYVGCATSHYSALCGPRQPAQSFWGNAQSIIPARIAYYLNLLGPAIAVDTACSSSLVAVHLACQALWSREIDMALAGGVFIQCTTDFFDSCNRARMLSPLGQCHTFDARADGFVPGEGVGAVALKRLSDAIQDGDFIRGVICGSAMNQDGSTNGITAPSALSQERLERLVYDRFNIDPATIGYVEAHGTGTKLGDPIELAALTRAFTHYTDQRGFCAVGSVKTNIGHAATAAGIAGLLKLLLCLRHRQIVPSLNFKAHNPAIDFAGSPFYVSTACSPWETRPGTLRRAAISSFGFSGTNAHLVVEEAPPRARAHAERPGYLIAVSARTAEQLRALVQSLLDHCKAQGSDLDLGDFSFTLLRGRKHWNHRLAYVVRNTEELAEGWSRWLDGKNVSQISVGAHEGSIREQVSLQRYGNQCIRECTPSLPAVQYLENLAVVADLYAQGYALDFERLFDDGYSRVPLPTYPFARDVYWVKDPTSGAPPSHLPVRTSSPAQPLHPLVHRDTSTSDQQRFSSTLRSSDPFLRDHVIFGEPVLPAVAYLEMVVAALHQAIAPLPGQGLRCLQLRNLVWVRPAKARDSLELRLRLRLLEQAAGGLAFEIDEENEQGSVVHARGSAEWLESQPQPIVNLENVRADLGDAGVSVTDCYRAFRALGIEHGPVFRGIESLHANSGEVLAEVRVPECMSDTVHDYYLHPSLLDSALQAAIALTFNTADADRPHLPFALQALTVYAPCRGRVWSWVRYSGSEVAGTRVLDIDLCDSSGRVCVRFKGLASRVYGREAPQETLLAVPQWRVVSERGAALTGALERRVVLCGLAHVDPWRVEAQIATSRCVSWVSVDSQWTTDFAARASQLLALIQEELTRPDRGPVLFQIVVPVTDSSQMALGLCGLLKTVTVEHPRVLGQVLLVEPEIAAGTLIGRLEECATEPLSAQARYERGQRWAQTWSRVETAIAEGSCLARPWRQDGVYLITGGLGGLGRLFAAEILEHAPQARLILVGRSMLDSAASQALAALQCRGRATYERVDIADAAQVDGLIARLARDQGALHGILHSAGVTRDGYVLSKSAAELTGVLAPKVAGSLHLDRATAEVELDFFVLCSSGTGVFGNVGQVGYAAANAWLDSFATYRNDLVRSGRRHGHTLSMIWPLWQDGGMRVDQATQAALQRRLGMVPMVASVGMEALYTGLAQGHSQLLVMQGERERMGRALESANSLAVAPVQAVRAQVEGAPEPAVSAGKEAAISLATLQAELVAVVAGLLAVRPEEVGLEEELGRLGFDSILLTDLANQVSRRFAIELAPTIFFEYPTLGAFSRYLGDWLDTRLASNGARAVEGREAATGAEAAERQEAGSGAEDADSGERRGVLAIVGMSGVFPMADDVAELWRNLLVGRDCISEVPPSRWNWQEVASRAQLGPRAEALRWGGFINGMDDFDPLFFRISPKEAELMDPQQRLTLMHAYRAIEDAGYSPGSLSGSHIGVFIGTGNTGYASLIDASPGTTDSYSSTGLIPSLGPNRVSYFLNLHGPSEPIETACSSSLVAIHRAMTEINTGRCDAALVGGVNTLVTPDSYVRYAKAGMLSSEGRCKSFSARADGYARAEGTGILFVKRLADAQRARDHIYALILASAMNHGGRANSLTAPNAKAQAELLKDAYSRAGVSANSIGYIETHGTGTELGDPVEFNGLLAAFQDCEASGPNRPSCALGSVKSNIGHLELAAGIAGVIKTVLQLQHGMLVKSLHCEETNPYLALEGSPFYLVRENQAWPARLDAGGAPLPRRAGVSSFGFGGTNAHVVLEEYPPAAAVEPGQAGPQVVPLSARTGEQLRLRIWNLLRFLERESDIRLGELAYTLQTGRDEFEERIGFIVSSVEELRSKLESALAVWDSDALVELAGVHSGCGAGARERTSARRSWHAHEEDPKGAVRRWLREKQYDRVLRFWVEGGAIPWEEGFTDSKPARMSLPTYPFARQRFWIGGSGCEGAPPATQKLECFTPVWKTATAKSNETYPERAARMLLVGGTPSQLAQVYEAYPDSKVLQMERAQSLESLAGCLTALGDFEHIVWIGRAQPVEGNTSESLERIAELQTDGVMQVFMLAKALMAVGYGRHSLGWTVVTYHTQPVMGNEVGCPVDASVHGFVISLAKEVPNWSVRLVDLDDQTRLPDDLWGLPKHMDSAYACRRKRWFCQSRAVVTDTHHSSGVPYRPGGVYVVVGGAGGLGSLWSRHVIEKYRARVYWIGRRAHDEAIDRQITELARLGPAPVYVRADAADRGQLERAYERIRAEQPVIHGVIQSVVGDFDRAVAEYDAATFRAILASKVDVAAAIAQVFGQQPLDFLLFFSSMASFARSGGMSAYSAGCVFTDAYTRWLANRRGVPAKVVNWGYWQVGSGKRIPETMKIRLHQEGIGAIDPAAGLAALERFLSGPLEQVMIWKSEETRGEPLRASENITVYRSDLPSMLEQIGVEAL